MAELEDTVDQMMDGDVLEPMEEHTRKDEETGQAPPREQWIALISCLLAALSAVAGLFASFYSDRAQDVLNEATVSATEYASRASEASLLELHARLLAQQNQPVTATLEAAITNARSEAAHAKTTLQQARDENARLDERHDWLAIAITLFQVAIVLSSISLLVKRNLPLGLAAVGMAGGFYSLARFFMMG